MQDGRVILHADGDSYYASVECAYDPSIRDHPVAVSGDEELRHGVVLSANAHAKRYGVKTGIATRDARQRCPGLIVKKLDIARYVDASKYMMGVFGQYSDRVQAFGLDEASLDITGNAGLFGHDYGVRIADEIRRRCKAELGITVSIGVSFCKVFAKLGSDLEKPDATTVISRENYRRIVHPLPAGQLLYVGEATRRLLANVGILSIGDIADAGPERLHALLGKRGPMLWRFASGEDNDPVSALGADDPIKSIGNSTTTPRDLESDDDVKLTMAVLAEGVAQRLRAEGLRAKTLHVSARDNAMTYFDRQTALALPTNLSSELIASAMELFRRTYPWDRPIRTLGLRCAGLIAARGAVQLSFLPDEAKREKLERLERAVDGIRGRFGYFSLQRAMLLGDRQLTDLDTQDEASIHSIAFGRSVSAGG